MDSTIKSFTTPQAAVSHKSLGATLATAALKEIHSGWSDAYKESCTIGLTYTKKILDCSPDAAEKLIAATSLAACDSVISVNSRAAILNTSLSAVSAGVSCPAGFVLADIGRNIMFDQLVPSLQDRCAIGAQYAKTVMENADNPKQKLVLSTSLAAYDKLNKKGKAAYLTLGHALLVAKHTSGRSPGTLLAHTGYQVMSNRANQDSYSMEEQCTIGAQYAQSAMENADSPEQKLVLSTALAAYGKFHKGSYTARGTLTEGLNVAQDASGKPPGALLARAGYTMMMNEDICRRSTLEDQRTTGRAFTEAIRDNSTDETQKVLAEATLESGKGGSGGVNATTGVNIFRHFLKSQF